MSNKRSLLLVDDEPGVLLTLKIVLERDDYLVTTASSCAEAVSIMNTGKLFDVVITDLCLERDDIGLEVARRATSMSPRPVILVITGFASIENARGALAIQIDHYALKPLDLNELRTALERLVSARQARFRHVAG